MHNYNKNMRINQGLEPLFNHLITRLPKNICSWNSKEHFGFRGKTATIQALCSSKWIEYNQDWLNMLIIDIDRDITLDEALKECVKIDFEPTWACKTDKGVHLAYSLENHIQYTWEKPIELAREIKYKLTSLLQADEKASHRLNGIYRNPIVHEHYFSGLLYTLEDFKKYLLNNSNQEKFEQYKKEIKSNNIKIVTKYAMGNRNDYVFRMGMLKSKNKNLSKDETIKLVQGICAYESKSTGIEMLPDCELRSMGKQISIYNKNNKNFVSNIVEKKAINRGAMNFTHITDGKWVSASEHNMRLRYRQKLSAKRTNERKDDMTRIEAAANMRKRLQIITVGKLETALKLLKSSNAKINISTLAKESGLSRNTVAKYIDNYKDSNGNLR